MPGQSEERTADDERTDCQCANGHRHRLPMLAAPIHEYGPCPDCGQTLVREIFLTGKCRVHPGETGEPPGA